MEVIIKEPLQKTNQEITRDFLLQHFTKEQTAGIMANLKQEHNFNTDDVPGGLGIAQWMGARREQLIQRGSYLDINVQLDFLLWELQNTEMNAYKAILASTTVQQATIAFQRLYERCGVCMQSTRIQYAYDIYNWL